MFDPAIEVVAPDEIDDLDAIGSEGEEETELIRDAGAEDAGIRFELFDFVEAG